MTEQNETGAMHQQHGRINREGKFTPVSDVKPIKIAVLDDELMKVFDYTYENYQPHVHFPVSI